MPTPVIMPKLEMSQETALVVEWLKKAGESVRVGEPIMVVETDKVTVDVESPGEGILGSVSVQAGDVVPVTNIIAYLYQPGEEISDLSLKSASSAESGHDIAPSAPPIKESVPKVTITPVAARMSAREGVNPDSLVGSGPRGRITRADVQEALVKKHRASPAARRAALAHSISLAEVYGSGPRGRIQTSDVLMELERRTPSESNSQGLPASIIPFAGMRRRIAERMQASYQTAPHISFTARVDTTALEGLRSQLKQRANGETRARVSITAVLVKIVAACLARHPMLNSTLRGEEILLLPEINIGIAVALPDGLIVPVIRDADRKGIEEIAGEVAVLTEKARQNKLQPADVASGTFTISNLGPFGIEQFNAIINPGQAAILAVGAAQPEVIPVEGRPEVRNILRMTLSVDHRIVDGAIAAQFMQTLKTVLESPALVLW